MENEDVVYISYRNDDDKKELWRVSPVTKIAEFVVQPLNVKPKLNNKLTKKQQEDNIERAKKGQELIKTEFGKYTEYYKTCLMKAETPGIRYITAYLIDLGYCEFQREGDQLRFKHYDDDPVGTIMKTKTCVDCNGNFIIRIDQEVCNTCKRLRVMRKTKV